MPAQQPAQKSLGPIASRRSHRKSRLGCANCKRRRIKCDEKKPECTQCVRHAIHCDFVSASTSQSAASSPADYLSPQDALATGARTPSGPGGVPSPFTDFSAGSPNEFSSPGAATAQPAAVSNISDLELLHNYSTSTAYTISAMPEMQTFYRVNVPQIGFSYPFLLHALMALSARHLAHFRENRRASYIAKANSHWDVALRTASALLPTVNNDNAPALYMFAIISCFYTLGNGPKERDFLIFSDHGLAEWLVLFRGVRAIMETSTDAIRLGPLSPLFAAALARVRRFHDHDLAAPTAEHPRILELRELALDFAADDPNLPTYVAAVDDLSRSYAAVFGEPDGGAGVAAGTGTSQNIFIWLYRVSDDFVLCLQQKQPMALAVFAHFVVLMNEMGSHWWMRGWVYHLLSGVHDSLDEGSRPWIRWPMEKLGWIPDV